MKLVSYIVPFTFLIAAMIVGAAMGYGYGRVEMADVVNQLNAAHQAEVIRIQGLYRPFMEKLGISLQDATTKLDGATDAANKAVDTANKAATTANQAVTEIKKVTPLLEQER
jgi:hypothetical protein